MSGGFGGLYSPWWFHKLVLIAQKVMPDIKRNHPNDDQAWLLAKALSFAYHQQKRDEARRKAEQNAAQASDVRMIPPHTAEGE